MLTQAFAQSKIEEVDKLGKLALSHKPNLQCKLDRLHKLLNGRMSLLE